MRQGVAIIVGALALAAPTGAHNTPFFWSVAKVMGATDGARVRVGASVVRINAATTLCSGEGTARRRKGVRQWRHFVCTCTTITRRGLGRDVDFRVHVVGRRRFVITGARWVAATT
jgi:hypothetical protein